MSQRPFYCPPPNGLATPSLSERATDRRRHRGPLPRSTRPEMLCFSVETSRNGLLRGIFDKAPKHGPRLEGLFLFWAEFAGAVPGHAPARLRGPLHKSPFRWLFPERHHWPKEKPASVNRRANCCMNLLQCRALRITARIVCFIALGGGLM
jgi:hypothetical protein